MTIVEVLGQIVVDVVPNVVVVMQTIIVPDPIQTVVMVIEARVGCLMVMGQECRIPHVVVIAKILLPLVMQSLILHSVVRQRPLCPVVL